MVTPTKDDLDAPIDRDDTILSPGLGNPAVDPEHINRIQNPVSYGPTQKTKQLTMINSKVQWNGKRSSFDELKRLIEGHFEGYGASYLVNRKFLDVYEMHGYKVLKFFPRVRMKCEDLEKQNATLYGSLKQICRKGAARAIIRKHERKRDGMCTWLDLLKRYDNMGSNDVMTIYYDEIISRPFHRKYPGGLEQFASDYEDAYSELAVIGETHSDMAKRRKILTNLYDPSNPETKILVAYCERNCHTFEAIIDHLTDTHIRDAHYNSMHSTRKAKLAHTTMTSDDESDDDLENLRIALKLVRGRGTLPEDYRIPSKAWSLLSPEAKEAFTSERDKVLAKAGGSDSGATPEKTIPKQYGGTGHNDVARRANLTSTGEDNESSGSDSGTESHDDEQLVQLLKSYKASRSVNRFMGMVRIQPSEPRTLHINVDPRRVRSLIARLSANESVAVMDGGCDTGLLGGKSWYIVAYTGRFANVVGFDEFLAKKMGLPIVIGITKCELPCRKGFVLLHHNEGVENQGSSTTLLSEFQLRSRGCIVDSTYKGHRGADG
jgi:hypothetical protein